MIRSKFTIIFFSLIGIILCSLSLSAQNSGTLKYNSRIEGLVRDSISHEPIPYAAIFLKGTNHGVLADEDGEFSISTTALNAQLSISSMGYRSKTVDVTKRKLTIEMLPVGVNLNEVIVKPKKEKYSKKNNPAVAFVEKIMKRQELTNPRRHNNYNYDKYERITLGLNNFTDKSQENWMFKQFPFLKEHVDTSEISGKPILNVSVKEKVSRVQYRKNPKSEKEWVTGIRRTGLDDIANQENIQTLLEDVFREVDLYENDINILQNRFVSPLSKIATNFYKFYLTDTIEMSGERCIELSFVPHNSQSFGFTGRIYVPENDSTMFIKRVIMNVPHAINLNFIDQLYISQEYERSPDGSRLKTKDDMTVEISVLPGMQGLYTRRNTTYGNHDFNQPKDTTIFDHPQKSMIAEDAYLQSSEYWEANRLSPISEKDTKIESLITKMRSVPLYYWTEKVIKILVSGYLPTSPNSKWDFGPMNTLISGNTIEGARFRVGGITTANLNKRLFARGYVAYGTKDEKFKYSGELEYSFLDKKYHSREFPVHSVRFTHLYDVDMIGQQYAFTNKDNIFLSLKRQEDTQMTYHRVSKFEYTLEMLNNFSIVAGLTHERQEATAYVPFVTGAGKIFKHYDETSLSLQLRYAPGEKIFQTKTYRYPINKDAPVFMLSHTFAPMNFLNNLYTINRTEFSVQKRFWFSAFGYTDIIVKAGHVWNKAAYPNLLIPNANLSYTIQPESYALMNPMEFVNDSYVSWDLTYWANGAIFNYIPYFKRLKLREVFTFRGIYGNLSDKNNPELNNDLFLFPEAAHTHKMGKTPYMEVGVGVENILKFLRVDYVWRLSYRNAYNVDKSGLRIAAHFTF